MSSSPARAAPDDDDEHRPSVPTRIAGEIRVRSWRRVWVAKASGPLKCPDGHTFRDPLVWVEGCLRCKHIEPHSDGAECGKLVYLVGGGLVTPAGQPLVILAEVTPREMREMLAAKMDHDRALGFLGIQFPE